VAQQGFGEIVLARVAPSSSATRIRESAIGPETLRVITCETVPYCSWKARASAYTPMSPPSMTRSKSSRGSTGPREREVAGAMGISFGG
jgi:hypothetical protein